MNSSGADGGIRSSVWENLAALPDREIAQLVEASISVLVDAGGATQRIAGIPPARPAAREVARYLAQANTGEEQEQLVEDLTAPKSERELGILALDVLKCHDSLAEEIAKAYEARNQMMVVDGGLILASVLLALVLRVKEVKIGSSRVSFYESRPELLEALRRFLSVGPSGR